MAKRKRRASAVSRSKGVKDVVWMGKAREDGQKFLNGAQIWELGELVDRLGHLENEEEIWDLDLSSFERNEVRMMRVYGGIFGSKIAEVFFAEDGPKQRVVILGVTEGNPKVSPPWFRVEKMRNRFFHYLAIS